MTATFAVNRETQQGEAVRLPEGVYIFQCTDVEDKDPSVNFPDDGRQYLWHFQVVDVISTDDPDEMEEAQSHIGYDQWHWTNAKISHGSWGRTKTLLLIDAIYGRQLEAGEAPNVEHMKKRLVRGRVGDYTAKSGNVTRKILSFKAHEVKDKAKTKPKAAPPPEDEGGEDEF